MTHFEFQVFLFVVYLDVVGAPSILRLTRSAAALARILPTLFLSCDGSAARRGVRLFVAE